MLRGEKADRIEPPRRRKHHLCSSAVNQPSETRKQLLIDDVWKFAWIGRCRAVEYTIDVQKNDFQVLENSAAGL
jgi:hypothetical protein